MSATLKTIQKILKEHSLLEAKAAHEKFVPGSEKIYGVRTPVLNKLAAQYKEAGFELIEALWNAGALEEKILAMKIMERIAKQDPDKAFKLIARFSKNIGNWAVCDAMGMQALHSLRKTHADKIFSLSDKFSTSKDLWQRRLSLVMIEWYTRIPERHDEINERIKALENDEEYYVKKAVVWIRKNFQKGK